MTSVASSASGSMSRSFVLKLLGGVVYNTAIFAILLFAPAGTLHWPRAWEFLGIVFIATSATMFGIFPGHEELLNERYKAPIQQGQPLADKIVVVFFIATFLTTIVLIPLDVFHFHLLPAPGTPISALGLILFAAGWTLIVLAFRENPSPQWL